MNQAQGRRISIGGQALIEGIMMKGPYKTAMAVRHTSGEIVLEEWENKNERPRFWRLPFFRGMYGMVESFVTGYKCLMRSAELAGLEEESSERDEKKEKILLSVLMSIASVLGILLSVGLFMFLPSFLYKLTAGWIDSNLDSSIATNAVLRGIFEGLLRMILFIVYMSLVSLMKDIRRTFMYHGAEHKTIFCYENGEELTVENIRRQSRFHPRCGT
ncbi:MAG: DUF1385 domain-containing protein, partial [Clostridia bacterium]|nr:DUF1385 domain-containing protein [Clostridia bacterium]